MVSRCWKTRDFEIDYDVRASSGCGLVICSTRLRDLFGFDRQSLEDAKGRVMVSVDHGTDLAAKVSERYPVHQMEVKDEDIPQQIEEGSEGEQEMLLQVE